jgi:nucleotide-binding universal stress UspA family protein
MTDSITRILVPVDFSPYSERAARYAATLAGQVGASVELTHVVEDLFRSPAYSEVYVPNVPDLMQEMINEGSTRLEAWKAQMFPHGADVETSVFVDRPAHGIVERAKNGGFDLIVMGTHGRTGVVHMLMGSVAERVVRTAPCAVLTVREAAATAATEPAKGTKAAA